MLIIAIISLIFKIVLALFALLIIAYVVLVIYHESWRSKKNLSHLPRFGNVILTGARALNANSPQLFRDNAKVRVIKIFIFRLDQFCKRCLFFQIPKKNHFKI